jgi:Reverse transcriptase (RNA-dependent DNA polymerase)
MNKLGFKHLVSDAGLFICKDFKEIIIAIVHVNNAMFFGKNKAQVDSKKKLFMDKWECRDLGEVKELLCMHITQKGKDIYLDQCDYLDKVLERFSMTNAKSAPTPLPSNWVPQLNKGKASPELLRNYQSIIGLLLYLVIGTCPDIAFAVTIMNSSFFLFFLIITTDMIVPCPFYFTYWTRVYLQEYMRYQTYV